MSDCLGIWTINDLYDKITNNIMPNDFKYDRKRGATKLDRLSSS